MRAEGERLGVQALVQEEVSLVDTGGHVLALVASGLLGAGAYSRIPTEAGALDVHLTDWVPPAPRGGPLARAARVFPLLCATFPPFQPRRAFEAWLQTLGLRVSAGPTGVRGSAEEGGGVEATFDGQGRLVHLALPRADAAPGPHAAGE